MRHSRRHAPNSRTEFPGRFPAENPGNSLCYTRQLPQDAPRSWLWCLSTLQHFHQDSPRQPRMANIRSRLCNISRGLQGMSQESSRKDFSWKSPGKFEKAPGGDVPKPVKIQGFRCPGSRREAHTYENTRFSLQGCRPSEGPHL